MKRKLHKRAVALLISLVLLLTAGIGAVVAYITHKTEPVSNTFEPSRVECQVVAGENGTYTIQNIGDTVAYIRVAVISNWKDPNSGNVYAQNPEASVVATDWLLGSDGYYYYPAPVDADATIPAPLTVTVQGEAPDGYELSVTVVASAIQATANAVADWSDAVTVDENRNLTLNP